MSLCKDCKHFRGQYECDRLGKVHPVNGDPIRVDAYAERMSRLPWHCGSRARFFESKR